jgi:chemotaxis protein CheD
LGKFGDLAAGYLLSLIEGAGGSRSRIRVKIAGAARMFGPATNPNGTSRDSIGDQNADAVRNSVEALGFSVAASDCGGSNGRKLFFDTRDGLLRIVTVRGELLEL